MKIEKIKLINYKCLQNILFDVNDQMNIFVGENDSGKSSLLEAIAIITTGKLNGYAFDRQIKANLFNYEIRNQYKESLSKYPNVAVPPEILLEAYCENLDEFKEYSGTNNSLGEDVPGIRIHVTFNTEYSVAYQKILEAGDIYDIPVEFYKVSYKYFSGDNISYRFCPMKATFIDTTRKDYTYVVDRFVSENITTYLTVQEQVDLSSAYRKSRNDFHINETVIKLNESVKQNVRVGEKKISIDLKEEDVEDWKKQMSVVVDDTPFECIGFGSQNVIKIELAIKNSSEQVNMVLMEEPENNLSYTNMQKLLQRIQNSTDKQIFISTHSSFIANKLGLENLFMVHCGYIVPLRKLNEQTKRYFKKLPGYDTLRLVLAEKIILVEGPTDDLIIQRAFFDEYGILPSDKGIDIIVVDSLAFKRYCDIAILIKKKIRVVTDNDGSIQININSKYSDYIGNQYIDFIYETNETLHTIEPSVLLANSNNGNPSEIFKHAISKNNSMMKKNSDEILEFMLNNKAEWAMRIFEAEEKINYPEYIKNAIKEFN